MEPWQITHIRKNLPDLLSLTICNAKLLAELGAGELLADADVKAIKAERNQHDKATLMYDILKTRSNSYNGLIRALIATKQSGAAKILLQLSPNKIGSLKISLQDAVHLVSDILSQVEIQEISAWIKNNLSMDECLKIHENIQAAETMELVRDTIPKPHALYIPRLLSRRLGVNPDLFEKTGVDVFVFKDIDQPQLLKFVKSNEIPSTCEQLLQRNITSRFLLLECDEDWKRICNNVKSPAHLIKFEQSTEQFVLEATTGGSCALRQYLQHQHDSSSEFISEDNFLEMISINNVRGVCICDSPGMGKSLLLANIARKARETWPERIVAFIQLQSMALQQESLDDVALKTLDFISTSPLASRILYKLYRCNKLRLELFLDGLDEVQYGHLDCTTKFLQKILEFMHSTTVFVTSRPVVRAQLEKSMCMIAYDIQPFNEETQLDYLTNHWAQAAASADMTKLAQYAEYCVQGIKNTQKESERYIAGVPLMCWLLAEVYTEKATTYADTTRKKDAKLPANFVSSLYDIYKKLFARQLGETDCKFACMYKYDLAKSTCDNACLVKSFHAWEALKLVCPKYSMKLAKYVTRFDILLPFQILAPGVLDNGQKNEMYVFTHRTFAEYLVAEYFAGNLLCDHSQQLSVGMASQLSPKINNLGLNQILIAGFRYPSYPSSFLENVVVYFLDAMISQNCEKVTIFNARISPFNETFFDWIEGCLHGNHPGLLKLLLQLAAKCTSEQPVWTLQVYYKLPCFWKSFNESIANALHLAAEYSNKETVDNLLQFFETVLNFDLTKALQYPGTLLENIRLGFYAGQFKLACYLLDRFPLAVSNSVSEGWFFQLHFLLENKFRNEAYIDLSDLIVTHNSFVLEKFSRSFLRAVEYRHIKTIKFFLSKKANIFAVNSGGLTILHIAAEGGDQYFFLKIVRILGQEWVKNQTNTGLSYSKSNRAPRNITTEPTNFEQLFNWHIKDSLQTPLHYAVRFLKDMQLETLDLLLAGGKEQQLKAQQFTCVNINAVDKNGKTALHRAMLVQTLELVKHLITRGADWTLKTKNGCNAVHICSYGGSVQHLEYFLGLGCNVNEHDSQGNNALQCALNRSCSLKDLDTWKINLLIDAGVNTSNKNKNGKMARGIAVSNGWPEEIVKLL